MTIWLCDKKGIKVACTLQFTAEEKLFKILKGPIRDNLVDWGYKIETDLPFFRLL